MRPAQLHAGKTHPPPGSALIHVQLRPPLQDQWPLQSCRCPQAQHAPRDEYDCICIGLTCSCALPCRVAGAQQPCRHVCSASASHSSARCEALLHSGSPEPCTWRCGQIGAGGAHPPGEQPAPACHAHRHLGAQHRAAAGVGGPAGAGGRHQCPAGQQRWAAPWHDVFISTCKDAPATCVAQTFSAQLISSGASTGMGQLSSRPPARPWRNEQRALLDHRALSSGCSRGCRVVPIATIPAGWCSLLSKTPIATVKVKLPWLPSHALIVIVALLKIDMLQALMGTPSCTCPLSRLECNLQAA